MLTPLAVPASDTVKVGCTGSEVLSVSVPERAPALVVGKKVTLIEHELPVARLAPQLLVCRKSPRLETMLLTMRGAVPVFDKVTTWAVLGVPMTWIPNVNEAGETVAMGAVPLPLSETEKSGFTGSLLLMASVATLGPVARGLNVMLIVQLEAAATAAPQVLVCAKSPAFPPVIAMLLRFRGELPEFESVTVWGVLAELMS